MSTVALQFEESVLRIEDVISENMMFSNIATKSTDSEERPSIFCYCPHLVYIEHSYEYWWSREVSSGCQVVAFMRWWFDLDVRSYLEYIKEKEHLARGYNRCNNFVTPHNFNYCNYFDLINKFCKLQGEMYKNTKLQKKKKKHTWHYSHVAYTCVAIFLVLPPLKFPLYI